MKLFSKTPTRKQSSPNRRTAAAQQQAQTKQETSFRRNRTLTGSSSSQIKSTNELNATLLSPRAHTHHLTLRRRHLSLKLLVIVVALLATYLLVSQLIASVDVRINGSMAGQKELTGQYQQSIDSYFSRHISERYYPSLNDSKLTAYLQRSYPEIKTVSVNLTGEFGKAQALVELRKPVARWTIGNKNEFVDSDGIVFAHNAHAAPGVEIKDENNIHSIQTVTSHRFLGFVGQIVGALQQKGYKVKQVAIPLLTTRQLEVRVKGVSYPAKMTIDRSAGEQAEDMSRVVSYIKRKSLSPSYIDVRVGNKAFYK